MAKVKRKSKVESKTVNEKEYHVLIGDNIADAVEKDLESDGIRLFTNENVDEDYLQLPADLTEVESRELGRYFNAFTQQKMYVRTVVGRVAAIIREKDAELNVLRSEVYSTMNTKTPLKEKELTFQADPRVQEQLQEIFIYEERLHMAKDYLEGLIDGITLISREISRRGDDWNESRREDNISNKRR